MKKRMFAMALSVVMAFSCVSMNVTAINLPGVQDTPEVVNGHDINIIPINVAEILAVRFVESNVGTGLVTAWTEDTEVRDVVPMFDENGVPTAFSVEFSTNGVDTGYVVVSAYPDVQEYILEYADAATPLYEELDLVDGEEVVYTSPLTYLKDDGSDTLVGLQDEEIARSDVENQFVELRDESAFEEQKDAIVEVLNQEPAIAVMSDYIDDGTDIYGAIADPLLYIDAVYGNVEDFAPYEWRNVLEAHTEHRIMEDFNSRYPGCCGPVAITNMIETAGSYRNITAITSKTHQSIYSTVENIGLTNGWFHSEGTYNYAMRNYMVESLEAFGVTVTGGITNTTVTYDMIKNAINADQFCILAVVEHDVYGNHAVFPYAYTRFRNADTGYYKSFVKVADGWSYGGRYIDLASVVAQPTNQWFYTVSF